MISERDQSWSLDLPGLTQARAEELVSFARDSGLCKFAAAVDPSLFLTMHLDRASVEALLHVIATRPGTPDKSEQMTLRGLAEDLEEWLDFAE